VQQGGLGVADGVAGYADGNAAGSHDEQCDCRVIEIAPDGRADLLRLIAYGSGRNVDNTDLVGAAPPSPPRLIA
jgi:hypothetical protein